MRIPVFELHILPMIRLLDRDHMRFRMDLWNYDDVVRHSEVIADRVAEDMPPVDSGGPWPDEWVQLFRRWMQEGFRRLQIGVAEYAWKQSATGTTIRSTGSFPGPGFKGWLQLESETEAARNYVLYFEAPDLVEGGPPVPFSLVERYSPTDGRSVFVRDGSGLRQLH